MFRKISQGVIVCPLGAPTSPPGHWCVVTRWRNDVGIVPYGGVERPCVFCSIQHSARQEGTAALPYDCLHHRLCHPERSRRISNFSAVFCTSILLRLRTRLRRCGASMRFLFYPTIYTRTVVPDGPYEVFVSIKLRRGQNGFKTKRRMGFHTAFVFIAVSP